MSRVFTYYVSRFRYDVPSSLVQGVVPRCSRVTCLHVSGVTCLLDTSPAHPPPAMLKSHVAQSLAAATPATCDRLLLDYCCFSRRSFTLIDSELTTPCVELPASLPASVFVPDMQDELLDAVVLPFSSLSFCPDMQDELLDAAVLPFLSQIAEDQDVIVRTHAVQLLLDLAQSCDSPKCADLMDIVEKVRLAPRRCCTFDRHGNAIVPGIPRPLRDL